MDTTGFKVTQLDDERDEIDQRVPEVGTGRLVNRPRLMPCGHRAWPENVKFVNDQTICKLCRQKESVDRRQHAAHVEDKYGERNKVQSDRKRKKKRQR